jgi:hypothetical protein
VTGETAGVVARVKALRRLVRVVTACSIDKRLSPKRWKRILELLDVAVKVASHIELCPLNARVFK